MVTKKKEDSNEESDKEKVETFICNEKIYWSLNIMINKCKT